ncbi:hypothetical protein L1987_19251 [Smallanthus sonchifolius]|uniref:Uncharacterized protein n=1 Tax=Smallanthus sonchifolius TaxID=185202 RepID=A0ACB9INT0_9ASTR|nr:hypothetical protein L1987_19251 [Smallanthus sonchifolius]
MSKKPPKFVRHSYETGESWEMRDEENFIAVEHMRTLNLNGNDYHQAGKKKIFVVNIARLMGKAYGGNQGTLWVCLIETLTRLHSSTRVTEGFKKLVAYAKCNRDSYESEFRSWLNAHEDLSTKE